uniref:Uncharacterized protein n=1 Tax=Lotharella globosa TaxID=91324 RepID=A0A7S4DQB5_9EUKA|mmetsp:Transcript_10140/g.20132  ORF Transcript_10140/g.20132 Transcript_10140/m.20132 type:complete len:993 (-) Transcript_10140:155-3133(-)|eukprot:CAMPEP_0167814654 /NCGR_PEP_ID=MMETSP0112_2-20121227/2555_1 /TAXON_ID=91324 /ORGANISM="Lotharella globosa, Strain CCCM811" /LENGTH=992 /DNA_ID=CAMNT_0007713923 /DNA_START=44 /DNA_END=3022 /DNA_ORIENTATION=-
MDGKATGTAPYAQPANTYAQQGGANPAYHQAGGASQPYDAAQVDQAGYYGYEGQQAGVDPQQGGGAYDPQGYYDPGYAQQPATNHGGQQQQPQGYADPGAAAGGQQPQGGYGGGAGGGGDAQANTYFNEQTGRWEYIQNPQAPAPPPAASSMPGQQNGYRSAAPGGGGGYPSAVPPATAAAAQTPARKPKKEERIDPAQIPRWSPEHKTDEPVKKFFTRSGSSPPPSTHPFVAVDEGNCSPRFIRMSTNYVANEADLVEQTKLCIGAIIQPLAELSPAEEPPPVREFGNDGPIRCNTCRAYINPFFRFIDHGRTFVCNMCGSNNKVPEWYFCNLDSAGFRRDRNEKAELCRGSVDFIAPADYCDTDVTDPCYLFVVDVTYSSLMTGVLDSAIECIRTSVDFLSENNPRARVGIMTYDKAMYFYSVKKGSTEPRLDVVADVDDAFVPVLPETILLPLSDEKQTDMVYKVLELIPKLHAIDNGQRAEESSCFGAAAHAGQQILAGFGGKMITIVSSLPNLGKGTLQMRNDIKLYHSSKEQSLLVPQGSFYQNLATECAQTKVSVDVFACGSTYLDLATIGVLSRTTGGQMYYYKGFHSAKHGEALHRDMYRNISRYTAFGGVMVIRTSAGLSVSERYGNYFAREASEMEIPVINCDSSFGVMLSHDSKVTTKEACVQTALLYTTPEGQRRIRIHTLSLPVTSALCNLFRHSDLDTIINLSLKQGVSQILYKVIPKSARHALVQACIDSLFVYRKYCSTQHSPGQLILPEPLKLLPLATLGMMKHNLFHSGQQVDERAFLSAFVNSMPTYVACSFVDPCLFSLTEMPEFACVEAKDGRVFLPPVLKLSSDSIKPDGIYLLDNGRELFIWIGDQAPQSMLDELFGVVQYHENGPQHVQLVYDETAEPTSLNARVWTLIVQLRKNCPSFKTVSIVTKHTHTGASLDEAQFFDQLIEDPARKNKWDASDLGSKRDAVCNMSYIDFLCHVHKKIQDKFI